MTDPMQLVRPSLDRLPSYVAALKRGLSPDNIRGAAASIDELERIEKDPRAFVDSLTDREAKGLPITLPDGTTAPRLPGFRLWLWDTEFCGSIGLRWQPGRVHQNCHLTSSDTLATRSCRGRRAAVTPGTR